MKKAVICAILLSLSLQGCGFLSKKKIPDATISEKVVHLDPKALEPCKPLVQLVLEENRDPFDSLLETSIKNMEIAADCSKRQENSIKLLKQFSNIKESK